MPSIAEMLRPACPDHPEYFAQPHGRCFFCERTTHKHLRPKQQHNSHVMAWAFRNVRATAFRDQVRNAGKPIYDQWDQQAECEWDGVDERIYD